MTPTPFEVNEAVARAVATGRAHALRCKEGAPVTCLCGWTGGTFGLVPAAPGGADQRPHWTVIPGTGPTTAEHYAEIKAAGEVYGVRVSGPEAVN